jgi:hypothetical protein
MTSLTFIIRRLEASRQKLSAVIPVYELRNSRNSTVWGLIGDAAARFRRAIRVSTAVWG